MKTAILLLSTFIPALPALPQAKDGAQGGPVVDGIKVEKAIQKGIAFLKKTGSPGHKHSGAKHSDELKLFTFIHADVPPSDGTYKKLLARVLKDNLTTTYKVSLQAMSLEEIERVKYQHRIAMCAQFLADNQCNNGQWSYGKPSPNVKNVPPVTPRTNVATAKRSGPRIYGAPVGAGRVKPKVVNRIMIKKKMGGPSSGDNSNTQYAALGLRACHDSGIVFDTSLITRAANWWRKSQHRPNAADSGYGTVRGWNYKTEGSDKDGRPAYISMSAGAVGSLAIYQHMLGRNWKRDPNIVGGVNWLAVNFSVTENKGRPKGSDWYYYGMYALERAGILYGTEKFGRHYWYAEGAKVLLQRQKSDGSWQGHSESMWNTCFAILFLKRATRPMVASQDHNR